MRRVSILAATALIGAGCTEGLTEPSGIDGGALRGRDASPDAVVLPRDAGRDASPDAAVLRDDAGSESDGGAPDGPAPTDCADCWVSECLARSGSVETVAGAQSSAYRDSDTPAGTVFDATTAVWSGLDEAGDFIPWTITFRNTGDASCWSGGRISGAWDETDPAVTWEEPYHHSGGVTIEVAGFLLDGVRIHNQGDGIRPYGPDARVRAAHLTDIHDDCIENDDMQGLVVEDSLLDGCYVGLSARTYAGSGDVDGSGRVWEVRNSLIRLEPQPTVYRGDSPGHGGFFKWDRSGVAPRLSLHDTILRADQLPNHGEIGIPEGLVFESCSNNTIVWLGPGDYPEPMPSCFTITTDRRVWDDAVRAWYARHPESTP